MLRNLLVLLFVVAVGVLCIDAKKLSKPRISCEAIGRKNRTKTLCIKQHGKSGKFSISLGKDKGEDDPKTVTIEFDAIRELDADGNRIGNKGPKIGKHSFENFASLDFDFTDLANTSYKEIPAFGFNFSATIPGPNATLNVPIYIFKKNGTVDLCDDEEVDVVRRMVKYNIELSNWNFCKAGSGCKGKGNKEEIGKFVEFVITIQNKGKSAKGKKKKKQKGRKRKAYKFFLGRNSISFPSAVSSDGTCKEMAEEYPKIAPKGSSKYSTTFRFPMFNDKVIYDPAVNLEDEETPPPVEPEGSSAKLLYPSFGVVMILGAIARLFF